MCQGRLIHRLVLATLLTCVASIGRAQQTDATLCNDAQLADVYFYNASLGWAVGDRGTIWHTKDGGVQWHLQTSNVDCRLSSVYFFDEKIGWAAGGWTHPYTHVTTGVVLRTKDGGQTWSSDRGSLLPAIRTIKFFNSAHGIAIGQSSAMFPAGIFATEDGGRSWMAFTAAGQQSWLTGDFADPNTGIVAGRSGALAGMRRKAIEPTKNVDVGLRSVQRVRLGQTRGSAWLVGDGALVMQTDDAGSIWQTPTTPIPTNFRTEFDFYALDVLDENIWIAGSPGTRVLRSSDSGRTWTMHETQQAIPIRALSFVDANRGWAVGDFGTILATHDGGRTWRQQRAGGSRAALLGIFSDPAHVPLELFAKLSGDDGYLSVVQLLNRTDVETPTQQAAEQPARTHEALVSTGACLAETAWKFPSRQGGLNLSAEQLLEVWNRATDGRAMEQIDEHLVRQIRLWRPNVVVTSLAANDKHDARLPLINQLVIRAIEHAADPLKYPAQLTAAGLAPWKVTKLYCSLNPGENGASNITSAQTTRTGKSVADLAVMAHGLLERQYVPSPANLGFRLMIDQVPQDAGTRDFFSGIHLSPGSEARRLLSESPERTVDAIRRSAQARRNLNAILARVEDRGADNTRYLAEVSDLVRTMDGGHAAEVLLQLADRYHKQGQWELAAESYDAIVERYPKHPAAGAALIWLVQYYASGEAAWRVEQKQQYNVAGRESGAKPALLRGDANEFRAQSKNVRRGNAVVNLSGGSPDRSTRAAGYARQLEEKSPSLFAEPRARFPLAAAHREQGFPRQAERFFLGFVRNCQRDAWYDCGQTELSLLTPSEPAAAASPGNTSPPGLKPRARCVQAQAKPRLDGKLDDAVWRAAKAVELKSDLRDDGEWPALVMLAHDDEFLYLAVSCQQAPQATYAEISSPRPRDGNLSAHDRVEIYLDIDRDYTTAYQLVIDARGWTSEACWGDSTWNPRWFVAADRSQTPNAAFWTAEAAIPISELTRNIAPGNTHWAIGIQRIVPNVGFQSWNKPAAIDVQSEGFGILTLE